MEGDIYRQFNVSTGRPPSVSGAVVDWRNKYTQMNNTMAIICSKMQILTQMVIKNLKKMLTESCTAVSLCGVARVADIHVSWLTYFPERRTKPGLREVRDANDSVQLPEG